MHLDEYTQLDAVDLVAAVHAADVSPSELAALAREQYLATNGTLNAVVEWYADPTPVANDKGLLAGVPFLVKDYGSAEQGRLVQMGSRLGREIRLLLVLRLDLPHQALHEAGMGRQAVVEASDLLAQILLLGLDQRPWIRLLDTRNEEPQESPNQVS